MAGILDPLTIRHRQVKNRIVLPPIVVFWAGIDGIVTKRHVSHYRRRAQGGCGMVIVEAACVEPEGRVAQSQLGIWDDNQVEGLSLIAGACRDEGAVTLIQIHHGGLKTSGDVTRERLTASDYRDEERSAREMTIAEIEAVRDKFIAAAKRARRAGFDGVELHGAHGFLLCQFASRTVNRRADRYGGDVPGRLRLAGEIIEGIRAFDEDCLVTYRMGYNEPALADGIEIAKTLERFGVDLLHVSSGFGGDEDTEPPDGFNGSRIAWGGSEIRRHVDVPVIGVSGIRTHSQAEWLLDGHLDMVALARGLLVDPDWPNKAADREKIITCIECKPRCKWFEDAATCPRYDEEWEHV